MLQAKLQYQVKKKKKSESDSNMTKIWELLEWEFNIIMIKKLKFTEDN